MLIQLSQNMHSGDYLPDETREVFKTSRVFHFFAKYANARSPFIEISSWYPVRSASI